MFQGRQLLIATNHKKEQVIAPLFEAGLGVSCVVAEKFDTDTLGTFTGEKERKDDALITVRNKCLHAMQLYDCDLAIASEGSFGPHPSLFFVNANEEFLMFLDRQNNLEIVASTLSVKTNFDGEEVFTEEELLAFAQRARFPSHALILRKSKVDHAGMVKGIQDWNQLKITFHHLLEKGKAVYVETDMRAMCNPTRMKVIEQAAQQLLAKIKSCCPACNAPGFGVTEAKRGLPCERCAAPTTSVMSYLYKCGACSFVREKKYPHQKTFESAMYCDWCNP